MLHAVCNSPNTRNSCGVAYSSARDFFHGPHPHLTPSIHPFFTTHITPFEVHNGSDTPRHGLSHRRIFFMLNGSDTAQDVLAQRRLFFMHCKAGALEDAVALFADTCHSHILMWNAIIQAHLRKGFHQKTFHIFDQMLQEGIMPNKVTFAGLLSACAVLLRLSDGTRMHARIQFGNFSSNLIVKTALLNMYGKCGSAEAALETMETLLERDAIAFNAMLTSLLKHELDKEVLHLFEQMQQEGVMPNRITYITVVEACAMHGMLAQGELMYARTLALKEYQVDLSLGNAFIHMYGKCNHPQKAHKHFSQMPTWDAASWNTLMGAYNRQGDIEKVLELFDLMEEKGLSADEYTYITLLSSCASHTAVYEGMCIHVCIVYGGLSSIGLSTALLSMYGRCGSVEDANRVFHRIAVKNVVSWNAMMSVCKQHSKNEDAVHLFHHMMGVGIQPDKVTLINVLSACANAALFAEGKSICSLVYKCGLQTDLTLGTSLVNMYGKCGELEEARVVFRQISHLTAFSWNGMLTVYAYHGNIEGMYGLFNQMQNEGVVLDDVTCVAFLSGCSHLGLVSQGIQFFMSIYEMYDLVPDMAHYVCMIDLLAKAGQLEEAAFMIDLLPQSLDEVSITALASAYSRLLYCGA